MYMVGASGPQILGYCRANYDYSANQPNQLSLRKDDRIGIISRAGEDRGWWKGQLRGKVTISSILQRRSG